MSYSFPTYVHFQISTEVSLRIFFVSQETSCNNIATNNRKLQSNKNIAAIKNAFKDIQCLFIYLTVVIQMFSELL